MRTGTGSSSTLQWVESCPGPHQIKRQSDCSLFCVSRDPKMICPQRLRLLNRHKAAGANLESARQYLQERMGACSKAEFLLISDSLDRATEALEQCLAKLQDHIRSHRCEEEEGTATMRAAGEA